MRVCECCNGNCDNGEIVQGLCPECREKKEKERTRNVLLQELLSADFYQMSFELDIRRAMGNV